MEDSGSSGDRGSEGGGTSETSEAGGTSEMSEGYYELLGVDQDASSAEIRDAYRDAAKRIHPDASDLPEREAARRFRRVREARDVLADPRARRRYDELGHETYREQATAHGTPMSRANEGTQTVPDSGPPVAGESGGGKGWVPPATGGADDQSRRGPGLYDAVLAGRGGKSASFTVVVTRWQASWRLRLLAGFGSALLVALGGFGAAEVLRAAGVGSGVSPPGPTMLYGLALVVALAATLRACLVVERSLPAGAFVTDREPGRFSAESVRRMVWSGTLASAAAFGLVALGPRTGVDPWARTAALARGEIDGFGWFELPGALAA